MVAHQPQAAFTRNARSLQFEWAYIQHVIEVEKRVFHPIEEAILTQLLTKLFEAKYMPPNLYELTSLPACHGGLEALYPVQEAPMN
eukprot:6080782-Ditylum_brightwellii.AAC.1